jgi:DUF971 family protein
VTPETTPISLDLKRNERLEVVWQDGRRCVYPISYLRTMCPCAQCRKVREGEAAPAGEVKRKTKLTILPGNFATPLQAVSAELVGNYALRIEWSDQHASGIYSFTYLREICPPAAHD